MIANFFLFTCLFCVGNMVMAQDFISRGKIEFEVKRNIKKLWGGIPNDLASSMPELDISYRDLIFSWECSIYRPGRSASSISPNTGKVYSNLSKKEIVIQKNFAGEDFIFTDSVKNIKWKITNETRNIIGFECRKAVGRIFDSVYVVAFYAPEIIPQGGPELFAGLPGMILGLAIPRYYTTWFATRLEVANIDESVIAPPTLKKVKQYSKKEMATILFQKLQGVWGKGWTAEKIEKNLLSSFIL
jgi:GLPGLI family protein